MGTTFTTTTAGKAAMSAGMGALTSVMKAAVGPAAVCTAMVGLDFVSAMLLSRRLRRAGHEQAGRLSSLRFGRVIGTLTKIYGALTVAAMVQQWVVGSDSGFDAVRFVAGAVCFWQLLSILENESTCTDSRWASVARRFLIDKAKRHLQ